MFKVFFNEKIIKEIILQRKDNQGDYPTEEREDLFVKASGYMKMRSYTKMKSQKRK